MSLVPVFAKCVDGKYYEYPKWFGNGWSIVLDDNDPPIISVAKSNPNCNKPWVILQESGLPYINVKKWWYSTSKHIYFEFEWYENKLAPVPNRYDKVIDSRKDLHDCVLYGMGS